MYDREVARVARVCWSIGLKVAKMFRVRIVAPTPDYIALEALSDHIICTHLQEIHATLLYCDAVNLLSLSAESKNL